MEIRAVMLDVTDEGDGDFGPDSAGSSPTSSKGQPRRLSPAKARALWRKAILDTAPHQDGEGEQEPPGWVTGAARSLVGALRASIRTGKVISGVRHNIYLLR